MSIHVPTLHPHSEELIMGGVKFTTFDLGGHIMARQLWSQYFPQVSGIVFLVDVADRTRFAEAAEELSLLLSSPELSTVPFCVLGNKIDDTRAASESELRQALRLETYATSGKLQRPDAAAGRPVEVFMCSIKERMGYQEAFSWLARYL